MNLKPVNSINNDGNTIRVSDGNSPIRLIFKDVKGQVINLYDKIDYFYLTKDDEKFYSVTDISYDGDEVIIRLPKLKKGQYKAEIRDKDGSIYPANEDLYILLRRSFEDDKDIYYFGHREDILNSVEPIIIQHIDKNPNKFKGERGQQGFPGRDGLRGRDGKDGKDGKDGVDGKDGEKGLPGKDGQDGKDVDYSVILQTDTIQVYIPSDFNTLQDAINFYKLKNTGLNVNIELIIESEHIINQGIYLENGDYSNFIIKSVDDIVKCDVTGVFMEGWRVNMPTLSCLIDMENKGGDGIHVSQNSRGYIEQRNGIINAGDRGIVISQGSSYSMYNTNFYGANSRALHVANASIVEASFGDFSNAGNRSVYCSRGSKLNLQGANVENSGETAVYAIRSEINAQDANVSGADKYGFYCSNGATIIAPSSIADNCLDGVLVTGASRFSGDKININNSGNMAVRVNTGSMCDVSFAKIENSVSHGLYSENGSIINANNSVILNSGGSGVWSRGASTVSVINSQVKGSNIRPLSVTFGGHIYAEGIATDNEVFNSSDTNISDLNTIFKAGIVFG